MKNLKFLKQIKISLRLGRNTAEKVFSVNKMNLLKGIAIYEL